MASRITPIVTNEYYHIFNRGVARQPIFFLKHDYQQALLGIEYYRFSKPTIKLSRFKTLARNEKEKLMSSLNQNYRKLAQIISYCFMPNHFHLLLRQVTDDGISKFIGQFSNSYTRYFNTKHSRVGPLFQGPFKSVHVESEEQLIHLSRYIHLNPYVSSVVRETELTSYTWSSYQDYLKGNSNLIDLSAVMSRFKSVSEYQAFVSNHADYARELEFIKHLTLDTG
ncbi:MAG: transposase [Patescibacteria group bacterium]